LLRGPREPAPDYSAAHSPDRAAGTASTDIRARIAARRPVRYLLPEAVAAYADKSGLYREAS